MIVGHRGMEEGTNRQRKEMGGRKRRGNRKVREKTWKKGHRRKRREETGKDKEMKKSRFKSLRGGNLKKKVTFKGPRR